jgi:nicotinamidase-related amidase
MVLSPDGAVLLLIDLQERLMPVITDHELVVARAVRLAEAATLLDVPVRATEQNPAGLGRTVPPLSGYPQAVLAKTTFSAAADPGFAALLPGEGEIVVAGVEAHVCVLQTVLDLLDAGARWHGAEVVTSEMVLFEWLRDARHPKFREVHKLVR